MKLLILSCNTGQGHNSAAKAIKDYFELNGDSCEIKDALAYWSPEKSKIISRGHVFIYRRLPKLFGVSYRFEENHPAKDGDESLIYELVTKGCKGLLEELKCGNYDTVICTHIFSAMMMTELRRSGAYNVKTYFVATDYTCSPGVSENEMDGYFIPSPELADEFVNNGVPKSLIFASGIPVNPAFYNRTEPLQAKAKLKLPHDKNIVILMSGSMGCGPMKALSEMLSEKLPENAHLVIICGSNRRLYKQLTKNSIPDNTTVIGFTARMSLYMDAASLIITKPGGLSSTEAAVKHLPMIFIDAVPGCETKNLSFFTSRGFADTRATPKELVILICDYLYDKSKLTNMSNKLKAYFNGCAVETIYNTIVKEQSRYENGGLQETET